MVRPVGSEVRQNLVELLAVLGSGYGYSLWKKYIAVFPKTTLRNVFYQLKKGVVTGEFIVAEKKDVGGNYSWGTTAEKVIYVLGPEAKPRGDARLKNLTNQ